MKRTWKHSLLLGLGLTVALGLVVALPAVASAAPQDFASGAGDLSFGIGAGHISFTGHGTPTDAHGQIHVDVPGTFVENVKGKVNCVFVNGNEANLSGEVTTAPAFPYRFFVLSVRDNGNPSGASPDQADLRAGNTPFSCLGPFLAFSPFVHGNAVVKDNTP